MTDEQVVNDGRKVRRGQWRFRSVSRTGLGIWLTFIINGGIVSILEYLEGGKRLWKSFVRTATGRGLKISLVDTVTGQWMPIDSNTADEFILSLDDSKK